MNSKDYTDFAAMRAELTRDYAPVKAQERLLVLEIAAAWQRLHKCRRREELFFDLQRTAIAIRAGQPPSAFNEDGNEVSMWLLKPHRAYDQILRAIRDAQIMFDRAIRRIEEVQACRLKRERLTRKDEEVRERVVLRQSHAEVPARGRHCNLSQRRQNDESPRQHPRLRVRSRHLAIPNIGPSYKLTVS